jgi:hypothetical protein
MEVKISNKSLFNRVGKAVQNIGQKFSTIIRIENKKSKNNNNENNFMVIKNRQPKRKIVSKLQNDVSENMELNNSFTIENLLQLYNTQININSQNIVIKKISQKYPLIIINKFIREIIQKIKDEISSVNLDMKNKNRIKIKDLLNEQFMKKYLDSKKKLGLPPNLSNLIVQAEILLKIQKYQLNIINPTLANNSSKNQHLVSSELISECGQQKLFKKNKNKNNNTNSVNSNGTESTANLSNSSSNH